jgi:hypothetical protein
MARSWKCHSLSHGYAEPELRAFRAFWSMLGRAKSDPNCSRKLQVLHIYSIPNATAIRHEKPLHDGSKEQRVKTISSRAQNLPPIPCTVLENFVLENREVFWL